MTGRPLARPPLHPSTPEGGRAHAAQPTFIRCVCWSTHQYASLVLCLCVVVRMHSVVLHDCSVWYAGPGWLRMKRLLSSASVGKPVQKPLPTCRCSTACCNGHPGLTAACVDDRRHTCINTVTNTCTMMHLAVCFGWLYVCGCVYVAVYMTMSKHTCYHMVVLHRYMSSFRWWKRFDEDHMQPLFGGPAMPSAYGDTIELNNVGRQLRVRQHTPTQTPSGGRGPADEPLH